MPLLILSVKTNNKQS